MQKAAQWLADKLTAIGMENTTVHPTASASCSHRRLAAREKPTDGSCVWSFRRSTGRRSTLETDPFKPVIKDGRMYGRGATDCKGGLYIAVTAVEALLATDGNLPVNLKLMFGGQEEIGSPTLMPWMVKMLNG